MPSYCSGLSGTHRRHQTKDSARFISKECRALSRSCCHRNVGKPGAPFSDLSGQVLGAGAFNSAGVLEGGYEAVTLAASGIGGAPTQPARVKPIWFRLTDGQSLAP
ncbi:MAG: hypothetical protein ABI885_29360 [Gammaproteobacteria bacterium]